jgi:uncharacterized protein (DUF924 family)
VNESAGSHEAAKSEDVLAFWREAGPKQWFTKDRAFDAEISKRFFATWTAAATGHLSAWQDTPDGALALVIVLDQFPRNMFRDEARAFETDSLARAVADRAIGRGFDRSVPQSERVFFYLPFEHSEAAADQSRCIALVRAMGNADLLTWAELHADIIRRFGRFPHRNDVLGRTSTPNELAFLANGGFAG